VAGCPREDAENPGRAVPRGKEEPVKGGVWAACQGGKGGREGKACDDAPDGLLDWHPRERIKVCDRGGSAGGDPADSLQREGKAGAAADEAQGGAPWVHKTGGGHIWGRVPDKKWELGGQKQLLEGDEGGQQEGWGGCGKGVPA